MELILNNPGFIHLAENIFGNLDCEKLEVCKEINESSRQMLDDAMFWIRQFKRLSKKNQEDWINAILSEKNSDKEKFIISYLKWKLKKAPMADLPCYKNPDVQAAFENELMVNCKDWFPMGQNVEIVKILAPLTNNPNAYNENEDGTPILWAAWYGYTEIVKVLVPLTHSPNAPNKCGNTPIHMAACMGRTEIIKILVPLTNNPNASNEFGQTPIYKAARNGHIEIVKILAPLSDNPNAPDKDGNTPTAFTRNAEIRRIIESFCSS